MFYLVETGENIKRLRLEQGLTQEETAYRAGISVKNLQRLEYGAQNVTADTLIHIADALHVNSRILAVFSWPDHVILSALRHAPRLPAEAGGPLQICKNIYWMRKAKGLTQVRLACFSNISEACLRNIEQACENVTMRTLLAIADALGLSLFELDACSVSEDEVMQWVFEARLRAGITCRKIWIFDPSFSLAPSSSLIL